MSRLVRIGVLGRPHGLRGGLRLKTEAAPETIAALPKLVLEDRGARAVRRLERVGGHLVVYLIGVPDRAAAQELVGTRVYAEAEDLPPLPPGSYYYHQLVGLPVLVEGEPFGEVAEVREAGAQDLLVVRRGLREYLVPLQAPYVEVREDRILLDPPPGLLET